ncbi:MAG: glucosamine-6-phosphate deaminase, partial [Bacteroidia bacterium]|nr:glucosamine-6-phosphate deaminase [Bacteroidia bacterium]
MRMDLSSHITLDRVPKKYYKPENDFEEYNLARYEKLPIAIYEEAKNAAVEIAAEIVEEMLLKQQQGETFVLGISGGVSPLPVYEELVKLHMENNVSFRNLVVFNTYEFYPVLDFAFSNLQMLKEVFLDK